MGYFKFTNAVFDGEDFKTQLITDCGNLHSHTFFEVSYVVRGNTEHKTPNEKVTLSNDSLIIIRPSDLHAFNDRDIPNAFHRDIIISIELFKECCDFLSKDLYDEILNLPHFPILPFAPGELNILENNLNCYSNLATDGNSNKDIIKKSIITNVLLIYTRNKLKPENMSIVDEILNSIRIPIVIREGIPALTKMLNYSHGHICRIIKQNLNMKLLDVLTKERMNYAKHLLRTTKMPIVEIAESVGYDSVSHFISVFTKFFSTTPLKYRKNYKKIEKTQIDNTK